MDSSLFSHPVTEESRPGARTAPQADRYGSLFRQPAYTSPPSDDDDYDCGDDAPELAPRPRRAAGTRGRGRR
ncbi:hypothetical protein ABZ342_13460 [Amycolatopsis sp. NPDC005961]|uniref:hypothetical protein n=1 Tax=Amycolatopsis sp. NPDC005961 TaxID=3156720 RepID=UPI0033C1F8BD